MFLQQVFHFLRRSKMEFLKFLKQKKAHTERVFGWRYHRNMSVLFKLSDCLISFLIPWLRNHTKSFLSSSHQFQITAFISVGITLHSGGHINVVAKGEENLTEEPGAENLLLAFSSCLQSANSNPGNGTRLVRVEPKLHLSQHSVRRKPGADGYGE